MCPPGRDTTCIPSTYGEFVVPTTGGHMGPPLRQSVTLTKFQKGSDQYGIYQYTGQIYGSDLTWIPRRGGPMCPPGRDTVRITSTYGEFVMPTPGGHTGPPLRRPMMLTKFRKESNQYDIYQYVERIYGSDLTRIPPWGQPMCPLGGDAVCITSTSGEFVMSVHVF